MEHTANRMGAFVREIQGPARIALESASPRQKLLDIAGAIVDQDAHGVVFAKAVAGGNGIASVQGRGVVGPDGGRNPTLGVTGVALLGRGLGEHEHVTGLGQRDCRPQRSDPAARD